MSIDQIAKEYDTNSYLYNEFRLMEFIKLIQQLKKIRLPQQGRSLLPLSFVLVLFLFRITYGIKPSGSIVYMNKDGGGSLDLLNIRSMAKVSFS